MACNAVWQERRVQEWRWSVCLVPFWPLEVKGHAPHRCPSTGLLMSHSYLMMSITSAGRWAPGSIIVLLRDDMPASLQSRMSTDVPPSVSIQPQSLPPRLCVRPWPLTPSLTRVMLCISISIGARFLTCRRFSVIEVILKMACGKSKTFLLSFLDSSCLLMSQVCNLWNGISLHPPSHSCNHSEIRYWKYRSPSKMSISALIWKHLICPFPPWCIHNDRKESASLINQLKPPHELLQAVNLNLPLAPRGNPTPTSYFACSLVLFSSHLISSPFPLFPVPSLCFSALSFPQHCVGMVR